MGTVTASTATSLTVTFSTSPVTAGPVTAAVTTNGVNISTVGMILMIVGGIGLLWSLIAVGTTSYRSRTVYDSGPVVERRVVRDDF